MSSKDSKRCWLKIGILLKYLLKLNKSFLYIVVGFTFRKLGNCWMKNLLSPKNISWNQIIVATPRQIIYIIKVDFANFLLKNWFTKIMRNRSKSYWKLICTVALTEKLTFQNLWHTTFNTFWAQCKTRCGMTGDFTTKNILITKWNNETFFRCLKWFHEKISTSNVRKSCWTFYCFLSVW